MNIENYETKEVECLKCGWIGKVAKHIPLRFAWCGGCRSSRLRLYHAPNKGSHTDGANAPRPGYLGNINPVGTDPDVS